MAKNNTFNRGVVINYYRNSFKSAEDLLSL
jgi:hypothetical protein